MDLEALIAQNSWNIIFAAIILLIILTAISLQVKHLTNSLKKFLFFSISIVVLIPTVYMIVSTIYLNVTSVSQGPVHWHADTEIWSCGKEINLRDPQGVFSNKIGTATLHEHNDKRIHLEGVVIHPADASLGKFFRVIGGELTPTSMTIPINNGQTVLTNGSMCPDGQPGIVQVFAYHTDKDGYYTQTKLDNPQEYTITPDSAVPPGDCLIFEFGTPKDRTDKLCRSYRVAEQIGKLKGAKQKYGN